MVSNSYEASIPYHAYPSPNFAIKEAQTLQNRVADTSLILVSDFEGANAKVKENRRNAMLNQLEYVINNILQRMLTIARLSEHTIRTL